jgi:uncharacterized protein
VSARPAGAVSARPARETLGVGQRLVLLPLRLYRRLLSPLKPVPSCRFHPTCSSYAIESVRSHGALRGLYLATARVLRCHPWHAGGFDPVPAARQPRDRRPGARHDGVPDETGIAPEES